MRSIDSDLKTGQFKQIYLLYGPESYLVRYYKHRLLKALMPETDEMNFTRVSGREADEDVLIETASTLPFFSDRRVLLLEDTGLLNKKSDRLDGLFEQLPPTTYLIFVEETVDKRKALYKKVVKIGSVEELKKPEGEALTRWMVGRVKRAGLNMTRAAWDDFLLRAGDSMDNMSNEMDKLIAYCEGKEAIEKADVDAICMNWMEGKIFEMIESIAARDAAKTLALYRDMLLLHEEPLHILAVMRSQFLRLLLLKEMDRHHESDRDIAARTKIPTYFLGKNRRLAGNFSSQELSRFLVEASDTESDMKTGRVNMQIGLEMLMMKYAAA